MNYLSKWREISYIDRVLQGITSPEYGLRAAWLMGRASYAYTRSFDGCEGPVSGRRMDYQTFEPGTVVRMGKNKNYLAPPLAGNTSNFTLIVQACLRSVGCRWNMPEYMISGDASNANYSSTLVSG